MVLVPPRSGIKKKNGGPSFLWEGLSVSDRGGQERERKRGDGARPGHGMNNFLGSVVDHWPLTINCPAYIRRSNVDR